MTGTMPSEPRAAPPIPIALVYWGRLGGGVALTIQTAEALSKGIALRSSVSISRKAKQRRTAFGAIPLFPLETFAGPISFLRATLGAPAAIDRLVRAMSGAGIRAAGDDHAAYSGESSFSARPSAPAFERYSWCMMRTRIRENAGRSSIARARESRGADRVVALTDYVTQRLIIRGDAKPEHISTLFHPTLTYPVRALGRTRTVSDPFRLLFFGRILPYKACRFFSRLTADFGRRHSLYVARCGARESLFLSRHANCPN